MRSVIDYQEGHLFIHTKILHRSGFRVAGYLDDPGWSGW